MPHAVTHVLFAVVILSLFRDYFIKEKGKFPLKYLLIGGIISLLPDLDVVVSWFLYFSGFMPEQVHRVFTHSLLLPFVFLIIGIATLNLKSKKTKNVKISTLFFVISFSTFTHLLLDSIIFGTISPLYPLSKMQFGLNLLGFVPYAFRNTILPSLDAIVFVLWLIHIELKHKLSSFI